MVTELQLLWLQILSLSLVLMVINSLISMQSCNQFITYIYTHVYTVHIYMNQNNLYTLQNNPCYLINAIQYHTVLKQVLQQQELSLSY